MGLTPMRALNLGNRGRVPGRNLSTRCPVVLGGVTSTHLFESLQRTLFLPLERCLEALVLQGESNMFWPTMV